MTRVGVTGHQGIPASAVAEIRARVRELLVETGASIGVSSLAAGADQIFAREVLAARARLEVVVPCEHYERSFTEPADIDGYRELLGCAVSVEVLAYPEPSQDAYLAAGVRIVEMADRMIAIWDGGPARGRGGTADVVALARSRGLPLHVVWPAGVQRANPA